MKKAKRLGICGREIHIPWYFIVLMDPGAFCLHRCLVRHGLHISYSSYTDALLL
jgi:hypothetical protein